MRLEELLRDVSCTAVYAPPELEIRGVSYDSREVKPGELFAAIPGEKEDGAAFIARAFSAGAVCALCRNGTPTDVPRVETDAPRRALAQISANWYARPAEAMCLIGVTGTNGKTTSTYLIRHILERVRQAKVGLVGTVQNVIGGNILPARRTTPESCDLQALLHTMKEARCTHAVMEVSSHALALDRVWGLRFAAGLFTNLTRDHLDFHGTMEAYARAKAGLFTACDTAVYNRDDPWHEEILARCGAPRISFGLHRGAEVYAEAIELTPEGVSFTAVRGERAVPVKVSLPGRFSVYNVLGAMAVALALGIPLEDSADALADFTGVKGRMEVLDMPDRDFTVLIDYAHTPDALENVLQTVRGFAAGRTVAVFGCGGDRDRSKRPQMGAIAARWADYSVVTSDNPRSEAPEEIIREIVSGMSGAQYDVVPERQSAIFYALDHAQTGDVIVLCGKGHETYQEIAGKKRHLDEREIVAEWLKSR